MICQRTIGKNSISLIINKRNYEFESIDANNNEEFPLIN